MSSTPPPTGSLITISPLRTSTTWQPRLLREERPHRRRTPADADVLTGGASAVYGSDAISGVVNFILNDDFEGFELGFNGGLSEQGDNGEYAVDMTAGGSFAEGRGNAVVFATYFHRDSLLATERAATAHATFNSSRVPEGQLIGSLLNPFPDLGGFGASPYADLAGNDLGISAGFDFSYANYITLPADRTVLGSLVDYDLTDDVEGYAQLLFADSRTAVQLAPAPLTASNRITIPAARALLLLPGAAAQAEILGRPDPNAPITVQRRMLEVGNRQQEFDKKFYQTTFGLRGEFANEWTWDTYFSFARTDMYDSLTNDLSGSRLQNGLNGCPPGADLGCTPIDPFGLNSISPAQANWLRLPNVTDHHEYQQQVLAVNFAGDLFELPAGPVGAAIGFEHRTDELAFSPAPASRDDLVGFSFVQPAAGDTTIDEVYAEAIVPLLANAPGARYVGLELGVRASDHSSAGSISTYKIGGEWEVVEGLRFRGMFNAATRAPSVFELFQAGDQNFPQYKDPCNSVGGAPGFNNAVVAQNSAPYNFCAAWLGLPGGLDPGTLATLSAFTQADAQVETFLFGNPNLQPEESETITLGAVYSVDTSFGDFDLTVDYYDIDLQGAIAGLTANGLLAACTATLNLASAACLATPRLPSGQSGGLQNPQTNSNLGGTQTTGYDVTIGYSLDEFLGGSLSVSALLTFLDSFVINGKDYVGVHAGLGGATPEFKSNLRTTYSYNDWQFSWQWEHISDMDDYGYSAAYGYPRVAAISYHDFAVRWFVTDDLELNAVCENCTDQDPQLGTSSGYAAGLNVDTSIYDVFGRSYRVGLRARF